MKKILIVASCLLGFFANAQTAPELVNDTVSVCNGDVNFTLVLANDSDPESDEFHITNLVSAAQNGTATLSGDTIYYTPNAGFRGQDQITYHVCDTTNQCADAFLVWNVDTCGVINTAPVANDDVAAVCVSLGNVVQLLGNDTDAENDSLAVTELLGTPVYGVAQLIVNNVLYTANDSVGIDSLQYVVCDYPITLSVQKCDTAWVVFQVDTCPPNNAPIAQPDAVAGVEDFFVLPFNPCDNDSDPDGDNITCTPSPIPPLPINGPLNGTLSSIGGSWTYTPNPNFNGVDGFTYKVCDDGNPPLCSYSVVGIVIAPTNDPPRANNDNYTVLEDSRTLLPVLSNDEDIDGDNLAISIVTQPQHGTIELINNQVFYTPDLNYSGNDAFRYRACDPSDECSLANAYITVLAVNDAPTPVTDTIKIMDNGRDALVDVVANDWDAEGDSFYIANTWGGTFLSSMLMVENGKTIVHVQKTDPKACGIDSVFYSVCDYANCDTGIVYVIAVCPFDDFMPQGFSPDGDGTNDVLAFPTLNFFRPLELIVFNRWGHPVYQADDYNNDWDGRAQDLNQPLPDGTYFYSIKIPDGRKYSSMCIINRNR